MNSPRVLFLSPNPEDTKNEFWLTTIKHLKNASKQLGAELEIIYTNTHHTFYMQEISKIVMRKKEDRPHYFIGLPYKHFEKRILDKFSKTDIKVFFINLNIENEIRKEIGYPREKYPNWIGHFYPDDLQAAEIITKEISNKCLKNRNIIAITGNNLSTASIMREQSFKQNSKLLGLNLQQSFSASWKKENVKRIMPHIESRYPRTCGFIVASDLMAEGVIETARRKYQVCSIDWTLKGLTLIKEKKLLCSAGGHFLEAAFSLVAIFDYHNGIDFKKDIGLTHKTIFNIATAKNIDSVISNFYTHNKFQSFRNFSKFYSKHKKYKFGLK